MQKKNQFCEFKYYLCAPTKPCPSLLRSVFISTGSHFTLKSASRYRWSELSVMSKSARSDSRQSKHLPIYQHKAELIQAVKESTFLVVTGETGSGKTTQLPQYLHQAGKLLFCCPLPPPPLPNTPSFFVQVFVKMAKSASHSPAEWLPSQWHRGWPRRCSARWVERLGTKYASMTAHLR